MPEIPTAAVFRKRLAALPLALYQAGDAVLTAGSRTGLLLILEKGSVAVVRNGTEIARVTEPGTVFGELSMLLGIPHTAEVRALETSEFRVTNADALLVQDPTALFYVATVLARRLDGANQALIELKTQLQTNQPHSEIKKTIENFEELLSGASLAYAGYPYDPYK